MQYWSRTFLAVLLAAGCGSTFATTAAAQLSPPSLGGGGGGAPPGPKKLDFRTRVVQSGGPRFGPTGPQKQVAEVRIKGNDATPLSQIHSALQTRRGRVFDPEVVQADVRRLHTGGHFHDVRTFTTDTPQGVIVTFEVLERPIIRYIKFVGNRAMREKKLRKQVGLQPGDPLNQFSVEEARRRIEEFYHSQGFARATVEIFEGDRPKDRGVVLLIAEGELERIWNVEFVGNTVATDARLRTQIESKPGIFKYLLRGKVDRDKIETDVDKLTVYYRNLGYFRARVGREFHYDDQNKWLTLRFVIDEGPRYIVRNVTVVGVTQFPVQELTPRLELQAGSEFSLAKMNTDVRNLTDLYGSHGYIYADVQAEPQFYEEPGQLDLVYNVEEGRQFRVGRINVHIGGDFPHTRRSVVLSRVSLKPGDLVDTREISKSERRLMASQLFETNPQEGEPPKIVIPPPKLTDIESLVGEQQPTGAYRGQAAELPAIGPVRSEPLPYGGYEPATQIPAPLGGPPRAFGGRRVPSAGPGQPQYR